jgi:putative copper resistance protein D
LEFGAWDAATVLAKTVTYAATFGASGGVMFLFYSHDVIVAAARMRIRSLVLAFSILALLTSGVRILVLAGSMGGATADMLNPSYAQMILRAGEGSAAAFRFAGLLMAGHALSSVGRPGVVAIVGAMLAATSFAWTGHPQAVAPSALPILLISVHLICVAFWLGALAPLLLVARDHDVLRVAAAATRFGRIAIVIVGLLIAAGAGLLWILIGDVSEFLSGTYGRAFLIKLGSVTVLLCFAAFNKLRLTPRLQANVPQAARSFARSVQFEMAIGGMILLTTAMLTTLWSPATLE